MCIRAAVEVMKILAEYAPEFTQEEKDIKIIRSLVESIKDDEPVQALRLLALIDGKPIEQIADEYEGKPMEFLTDLMDGLVRNQFVQMLDAAFYLGVSKVRWDYGRGN